MEQNEVLLIIITGFPPMQVVSLWVVWLTNCILCTLTSWPPNILL